MQGLPATRNRELGKSGVLILAKGFPPTPGGVEQYSQQVARAYAKRNLPVCVITQWDGPKGWLEQADSSAMRVWNAGAGGQAITFGRMVLQAARLRSQLHPRFVHATTWRVAVVAVTVFPRKVLALTIHGREVLNYPWYLRLALRGVVKRADVILAVSKATMLAAKAELAASAGGDGRWHVSYNGLTHPNMAAIARHDYGHAGPLRILSLFRLVPRKNVSGCLRALAALARSGELDFEYLVVGSGPERAKLEQEAQDLGIESKVRFLGYVPDEDVPKYYEWADIFLHAHTHVGEGNDFEGFGIAIADAMSFGCAVIVGAVGGPRELVSDGRDGILIDGNDDHAIARAVKSLGADVELRARLGSRAKEHAFATFSWDQHIEPVLSYTRPKIVGLQKLAGR